MSDTTAALRHRIGIATDLQSVVRTMRALAASSIGQYERSVLALTEYRQAVNQGLAACLRQGSAAWTPPLHTSAQTQRAAIGAIVFGSDQGLVGQFNEVIVEHALHVLGQLSGSVLVWAVGERVRVRLQDAGLRVVTVHPVPNSVAAIATLVGHLQIEIATHPSLTAAPRILLFHNMPKSGALYRPVDERLLPLDALWLSSLLRQRWPTTNLPEVLGPGTTTLHALIREHLFVSLFQACAESLASENASRLAAMQRADKNIEELLVNLRSSFHRRRQTSIDEELFDVIAGCESSWTRPFTRQNA